MSKKEPRFKHGVHRNTLMDTCLLYMYDCIPKDDPEITDEMVLTEVRAAFQETYMEIWEVLEYLQTLDELTEWLERRMGHSPSRSST